MVVFVLAILFVSVVFLGGLYRAKLYAMQDARGQNMYNATNSCEPKGFSPAFDASIEQPSLPQEAKGLGVDLVRTVIQGGGVSRTRTTGAFRYGPRRTLQQPNPLFLGYEGKVTADSYTLCNEKHLGVNLAELAVREFKLISDTLGADFGSMLGDLF